MLQRILSLFGTRRGAGKELCDAIGVKPNSVTEWRKGRMRSYTKYAPQIAAYYGVSLDWLSGATDEKEHKNIPTPEGEDSKVRREIIGLLDDMSEEQLEKLLAVIDLIRGS